MLYDRLASALAVIPVIVGVTLINVIIASVMGMVTFLQLLTVAGWSKLASEAVAILVAIAVMGYIWLQPKIRNYISGKEQI
jgi:hypothetical protein